MLIEIVAAVVGAFAGAGLYLAALRLIGRRPPRWTILAVAAVAMIAVVTGMRYGWGGRTAERLPDEMVVIDRVSRSTAMEPWTLIWPMSQGLVAVDRASRAAVPGHAGMVAVDLVLIRRGEETLVARHLVDCAAEPRRTARLPAGADPSGGALPPGLDWSAEAPMGLFEVACPTG